MKSKLLLCALLMTLLGTVACSQEHPEGADRFRAATLDPTDATTGTTTGTDDGRPLPASDRNVVVVVVDDASDISCEELPRFLPRTSALLRDRGRCYENATVTSPACCPSRAVLQTAQMGHNSGVTRQIDADRLRVEDTLQHQLTEAGWDTYGTGKYFNGISSWLFESGERSSGFLTSDFWEGSKYYGYPLWNDETQQPEVQTDGVHTTTRTGQFLRSFIADHAGGERPFYAYAAFKAPHTDNSMEKLVQRDPIPTEANRDRPVPPFRWRPETDTSDKLPIYQQQLRPRSFYERRYEARTRSMYDVDDEMGKTFDLLRDLGELEDTAILFVSDNGYHLGENGWETKGDPYGAAMDVPMLAWLPSAFGEGVVDTRPVGLIDVAPTVYDLLGLTPDHLVDGHSLLDDERRTGTFYELENEHSEDLLKEAGRNPGRVPTWAMYRSGRNSYVEYYRHDGSLIRSEFYRGRDYDENLLWPGNRARRPDDETLAWFRARLLEGRTCAGTVEQGSANPCP
ncbi:sulfatase-like hydrolase/transferase [Nocardioides sp. 1609]|uniref:sulfatase-like hydrolase/transferase n=1 Tax=Nocardioides sp. 1609 TaxID=2508327 RepID=UPI00106FAC27|nr:sulfatase-like hydrolase/transferase [Nocardioides sp. 1609]